MAEPEARKLAYQAHTGQARICGPRRAGTGPGPVLTAGRDR
jgi:hypothetical protein